MPTPWDCWGGGGTGPPDCAMSCAGGGGAEEEGGGGPTSGWLGGWAEPDVVPVEETAAGGSYCVVACTPSRSGMEESWGREGGREGRGNEEMMEGET